MSDSQLASFSVSKAVAQLLSPESVSQKVSNTQFVNRKSFSELVHVSHELLTQLVSITVTLLIC